MRALSSLATCLSASLLAAAALAQVPAETKPGDPAAAATVADVPAAPSSPQLTREDLEAWLDGLIPFALGKGDIAGAVVIVVKDGQVLLQKGYGYADVGKKAPVDSERTLFRPGSISKLFTWTAVMQQVERGKIDLDADVNQYLDFEIPPGPDGEILTMRNIMTHTGGFEEAVKELISEDEATIMSLEDTVKTWVPRRIFKAGTMPAYSNYATGLAGYIVSRTSGMSFDDYLDRNVFGPLGMANSSFRQPLPAALKAGVSQGYEQASKEPQGYELINLAPAGSLAATGADMARFMIAHLQDGAYGDARILSEETAKQMHGTPLTILPNVNRMVLGFYETSTNGHRIISHGGDTQYFHSDLHLFLDDGVGYYISFNSGGKQGSVGPLREAFYRSFADRYFPGPAAEGEVDEATAKEHAAQIAGSYISSRRAETSFLSLLNLLQPLKVVANEDGTISVPLLTDLNGEPTRWKEIAPYLWREKDGKARLAADVQDGKVVRFAPEWISPFMYMERSTGAKGVGWLMPATIASLGVLALTVLFWPVTAVLRRRYARPLPFAGAEAKAYRHGRIGALLSLVAIGGWIGVIMMMFSDLKFLSARFDWLVILLHVVGTIAVFAGLVLLLHHLVVVFKARRRIFGKIWAVLLALAGLVCAWVAVAYHLVGLSVNY
ncbi:MAG TPA: serine hydrolase domain-containing protein [Steroidobacteraceae bacterium]|nr:serine hydrolase domain-containing protein [Steroidobacteraceae bacterium]